MRRNHNLETIREKIHELKTAIMYDTCHDDIVLPNAIVTALQVDNEGQLWFACQNFSPQLLPADKVFMPCLHFYRKNIPFYLKVSGKTALVNIIKSDEAASKVLEQQMNILLFKMKMDTLEYTEITGRRSGNRIGQFIEAGYNWMLRHIVAQAPHHSLSR